MCARRINVIMLKVRGQPNIIKTLETFIIVLLFYSYGGFIEN